MTRFIRIRTRDNQLLGVNLDQIASIHIEERATLKRKNTEGVVQDVTSDVVRMYTSAGTEFVFVVGYEITAEEFSYICSVVSETLYKTKPELEQDAREREMVAIKKFENDTK